MVLNKEEFESKLTEKEFQLLKPTLIEDIIPLGQIESTIQNGPFSSQCKKSLIGFANTVTMLIRDSLPIATTIMLVGNENLAKMKQVVMSVLIGHGLCSNILYDDVGRRYQREKIAIYGNAFVEFSYADTSFELKEQIESARYNSGNTFLLFCLGRKFAHRYLTEDGHLYPFYIEDKHNKEEKYAMISKMCSDFGFEFVNNINTPELETEGYLSLKQQTYSLLIKALMNQPDNRKILLSDIIEPFILFEDPFMDHEDDNDEIPESSPTEAISYKDIIGLYGVKTQLGRLAKYLKKNHNNVSSRHMVFLGNPGTGKTTMARCLQQELYKLGVIKKNIFVETDRGGLCGRYVGETAQKTQSVFHSANGGVLFVDEAYALSRDDEASRDYGFEAITTLVKLMEDNRESTIVIFAGYPKEMKVMLSKNPGLESRIQFHFSFPDYSVDELRQLFETMLAQKSYTVTEDAMNRAMKMFEKDRTQSNFSNGRYIRNFVEKLLLIQCDRDEGKLITIEDIEQYLKEQQPEQEEQRCIGF